MERFSSINVGDLKGTGGLGVIAVLFLVLSLNGSPSTHYVGLLLLVALVAPLILAFLMDRKG